MYSKLSTILYKKEKQYLTPQINFRISPELHERIKTLATKQGKTVSGLIKELLTGCLESNMENRVSLIEKRLDELEKRVNKK